MGVPLRVAQVVGYMNGGGVEQVVTNYHRHIDRSRVQFDYLVCKGSTMVPREEIESLGGRVFMVPGYSDVPGYRRELLRLFREERWPIVHSHMNALSVFPLSAAKAAGVSVRIAHSHSTSGKGEPLKNAAKAVLRRFSNVYPTHRMACSHYAGEWLFGRDADFEVVPNAIELDRFAFDAVARKRLRSELGAGPSTLVVGHVGRFVGEKNHRFLVEVFSRFHRERPDSMLALVGEGPLRLEIEGRVERLGLSGSVCFLGQRGDVNELYSAFDVFCLPSLCEGLGMVAVEAQASGVSCVLSTGVPEEADLSGSCSFLSIKHPDKWCEALVWMTPGERNVVDRASFLGYDVEDAAVRLTRRYADLLSALPVEVNP